MKKYLITLLGVIFLLPAFAYASTYCVEFPTSGNSKWSKRDNDVKVRFVFGYLGEDVTNSSNLTYGVLSYANGHWDGTPIPRQYNVKADYTKSGYGWGALCLDFVRLQRSINERKTEWLDAQPKRWRRLANNGSTKEGPKVDSLGKAYRLDAPLTSIWVDVKWGADCPKVKHWGQDYRFKIYRRKHDHVNPWGCKRI